jgi:hypothetical protein
MKFQPSTPCACQNPRQTEKAPFSGHGPVSGQGAHMPWAVGTITAPLRAVRSWRAEKMEAVSDALPELVEEEESPSRKLIFWAGAAALAGVVFLYYKRGERA